MKRDIQRNIWCEMWYSTSGHKLVNLIALKQLVRLKKAHGKQISPLFNYFWKKITFFRKCFSRT